MKKVNKSQKDSELNEILSKLKEIFEYYCSQDERLNTKIQNQINLLNFLKNQV